MLKIYGKKNILIYYITHITLILYYVFYKTFLIKTTISLLTKDNKKVSVFLIH